MNADLIRLRLLLVKICVLSSLGSYVLQFIDRLFDLEPVFRSKSDQCSINFFLLRR